MRTLIVPALLSLLLVAPLVLAESRASVHDPAGDEGLSLADAVHCRDAAVDIVALDALPASAAREHLRALNEWARTRES